MRQPYSQRQDLPDRCHSSLCGSPIVMSSVLTHPPRSSVLSIRPSYSSSAPSVPSLLFLFSRPLPENTRLLEKLSALCTSFRPPSTNMASSTKDNTYAGSLPPSHCTFGNRHPGTTTVTQHSHDLSPHRLPPKFLLTPTSLPGVLPGFSLLLPLTTQGSRATRSVNTYLRSVNMRSSTGYAKTAARSGATPTCRKTLMTFLF